MRLSGANSGSKQMMGLVTVESGLLEFGEVAVKPEIITLAF